jgi:hypothetical protein
MEIEAILVLRTTIYQSRRYCIDELRRQIRLAGGSIPTEQKKSHRRENMPPQFVRTMQDQY